MTSRGSVSASTSVPLPDAAAGFAWLRDDLLRHGVDLSREGPKEALFRHEGCSIRLRHGADRLQVALDAPNANALFFLKEAAARHLVELAPAVAEAIVWTDAAAIGALPDNLHELILLRRVEVAPQLMRLSFRCDSLPRLADDGFHVKFLLPPSQARPPVWPKTTASGIPAWPRGADALAIRYYTLRELRRQAGEIDIDIVLHAGGRVSAWAETARAGDRAALMGPGGGGVPDERHGLLLAGDLTAAPAIARIIEAIADDASGHVVLQWPDAGDVRRYLPATPLAVTTVALSAGAAALVEAARRAGLTQTTRYGWFAGEFAAAQAMRAIFKGPMRLARGRHLAVAYWREGSVMDAEVSAAEPEAAYGEA